jgi:hypothetical protein
MSGAAYQHESTNQKSNHKHTDQKTPPKYESSQTNLQFDLKNHSPEKPSAGNRGISAGLESE